MTSNLGQDIIVSDPKIDETGKISAETKGAVMEVIQQHYNPEFLARIDETIIFQRLSRDAIRDIVDIRIKEVQEKLDDRRIKLDISDEVKEFLEKHGYSPKYGA